MSYCTPLSRCLICRRVTLENSEQLFSNATLLQDFLICFHGNVLDSEVHDLSTSCQFCQTCGQFLLEWSSIQTQMNRRAAQLKATLSALLLSAPEIQEQNHEDVTDRINNKIRNSQHVELPLLLQQTFDVIWNELRRKYLVNVMVDKAQLPCPPRSFNKEKFAPISVQSENDDEPMDDWMGSDYSNAEHMPNEAKLNDVETCEQILVMRIKTEGDAYSDDCLLDSVNSKLMKGQDGTRQTNRCPKDSVHDMLDKIPFPSLLKLEPLPVDYVNVDEASDHWKCGTNVQLPDVPKIQPLSGGQNNDDEPLDHEESGDDDSDEEYLPNEDEESSSDDSSLQDCVHSMEMNVKTGNIKTDGCPRKSEKQSSVIRDGPNNFKFNGYDIKLNDEDKCFYCGVCNFKGHTTIASIITHIRTLHYSAEDKIKFSTVRTSDTEWLYGGKYKIIKQDEKNYQCVSCGSAKACLYKMYQHIRNQHAD